MSADALRSVLTTQLNATVARRSYDEIFRDVPPAVRGVQPAGLPEAYSLWQILEHMRVSQANYLDYCTYPDYTASAWPDDYWPDAVVPPSDDAWEESLEGFSSDLQAVLDLVNDPSIDIAGEIPHASGESYHSIRYADEIASIADHNAYHLGQFVTVRRLLDAWPPSGLDAPDWEADE